MTVQPSFSYLVSGERNDQSVGRTSLTAGNTAGGPFNVTATANGITSAASQVTINGVLLRRRSIDEPIQRHGLSPRRRSISLAATSTQGTNLISNVKFYARRGFAHHGHEQSLQF